MKAWDIYTNLSADKSGVSLPNDHQLSILKYNYSVLTNYLQSETSTNLLKIIITETYSNMNTEGGSTFRIDLTSQLHRQVCPVKDFFNGTYLSCCLVDTKVITYNFTVAVSLKMTNFESYQTTFSNNMLLWKLIINVLNKRNTSQEHYQNCVNPFDLDLRSGYWLNTMGKHSQKHKPMSNKYVIPDNRYPGGYCMFPYLEGAIQSCIKEKYNGTTMIIGDSHARFIFYYLIQITTGRLMYRKIKSDITYKNHQFKWCTYVRLFANCLKLYLTERLKYPIKNTDHVLMLHTGSWDMITYQMQVSIYVINILLFYIYVPHY